MTGLVGRVGSLSQVLRVLVEIDIGLMMDILDIWRQTLDCAIVLSVQVSNRR